MNSNPSKPLPNVECGFCDKKFYKRPSKMTSKSGIYFCSREHQGLGFRKGSGIAVTSGPPKTTPDTTRYYNCKQCSLECKETLKNKTFCGDDCKEIYIKTLTNKICNNCEQDKLINEFSATSGTFDNLSHICKECISTSWKEWYQSNETAKENNNKLNKHWVKTEKGKAASLRKRVKKYGITVE